MALVPVGRARVEGRREARLPALELGAQQVAEEAVEAVDPPVPVERDHEGARVLERVERPGSAEPPEQGVALRAGEPVEHRDARQELDRRGGQTAEQLLPEVVGDVAVGAAEVVDQLFGQRPPPERERGQLEAGGPALRLASEPRGELLGDRDTGAAEEQVRLPRGQPQVVRPHVAEPALDAQPRERDGRLGTPGEDDRGAAGHVVEQRRQRGHRPGSGQEVDVLDDEDERNPPPRERAGEERHDHARRREPGKRLRDGRVDGLGPVHRGGDVGAEGERVVALVDRDPGEGPAVEARPLLEQGALAVPGRRDDGDDARVLGLDALDEVGARDRAAGHGRRRELRLDQRERRYEPRPELLHGRDRTDRGLGFEPRLRR